MPRRNRRDPPESAGPPAAIGAPPEPAPGGTFGLNDRHERIALCVASGLTQAETARQTGAGVRTVYDVIRRPDVVARIQQLRRDNLSRVASRVNAHAPEAADRLAAMMRDETAPHAVRVQAMHILVSHSVRMADQLALRDANAALEAEAADLRRQLDEVRDKKR